MIPPLVVTKYTLPPERSRQVTRERLMERLLAGLGRKCTLISAPAGFGKSTVAADLARRTGWPTAWVSLDVSDNDPSRWGAYITTAIRQAGLPVMPRAEQPPLHELIATVINAVAAAGSPLLLVLDDYHVIQAGEVHEAVALLLSLMPPQFHLVITTRTRPPLPLARLKAQGALTEITGADLRFSPEETGTFLREVMGLDLPDDGISMLAARTEGWVAGLQLAALSLHAASDWLAAIRSFNGRNPDLLEYLVDEVIRHQPEPMQAFLLQTAILGRLTGPLCEVVTGQTEGHRTLQTLEQANLFIFPLDPERRWFRYHPLFAEFLLARLRDQVGAEGVTELHRRAAAWFHQDGQIDAAIDHLLEAGAHSEAADLLEEGFAAWGARAAPAAIHRCVTRLPKWVVRERPRVAIMAAWALIANGEVQAEPVFNVALDYLDMATRALKKAEELGADIREARGVLAAVRIAMAPWAPLRLGPTGIKMDAARAVEVAKTARQLLPGESLFWRSVVSNSLGAVFQRASHFSGAAQAFGEAARLGARSGSLVAALTAMHRQAQLLVALGQPGRADETYREALRLAAEQGAEALPTLAPAYLGIGQLQYEWNHLEEATRNLEEALRRYTASGRAAPEALLALARLRQATGDLESARALVEQAGNLLYTQPKRRAAASPVWPDGVRVLLAQGDVASARRWVQAARVETDPQPDLWRAPEYFALARVLVAEGRPEPSLPLLRSLWEMAISTGCRGIEAECRVIEALALNACNSIREARTTLRAALDLTAPDELVRLYADSGKQVFALLRQIGTALRQGPNENRSLPGYVDSLLTVLPNDAHEAGHGTAGAPVTVGLVEPLTEREQEILSLIATGCSNQVVARKLFMGVSTVKWHLLNIYGKLQVRNRTAAVARARSLGLL